MDTLSEVFSKVFHMKNNEYMRLPLLATYANHYYKPSRQQMPTCVYEWFIQLLCPSFKAPIQNGQNSNDFDPVSNSIQPPTDGDMLSFFIENMKFTGKDDPLLARLPSIEQVYALVMNHYRPTPQFCINALRYIIFLAQQAPSITALYTKDITEHAYGQQLTPEMYQQLKLTETQLVVTLIIATYEYIYQVAKKPQSQIDILRDRILHHCGQVELTEACFDENGKRVTTNQEIQNMISLLEEINARYKKRSAELFEQSQANEDQDKLTEDQKIARDAFRRDLNTMADGQPVDDKLPVLPTPEEYRQQKFAQLKQDIKYFKPVFLQLLNTFPQQVKVLFLSSLLVTPYHPAGAVESYTGIIDLALSDSVQVDHVDPSSELQFVSNAVYADDYQTKNHETLRDFERDWFLYTPEFLLMGLHHLHKILQS
eukprot:UN02053